MQRLGQQLGGSFVDGGRHPRFGTRNFVLPLEGGTYVEVVAALDHPASDKAMFGQAVKARAESGGGWLGWVVSVDDISVVEARLGRPATDGHRVRPDGFDLNPPASRALLAGDVLLVISADAATLHPHAGE